MTFQRRNGSNNNNNSLFHQLVVLLFLTSATTTTWADTVLLASCPQEPQVFGTFVNNGYHCVREQVVLSREIVDAECPEDHDYRNGYCRKRLSKNIKPTCPTIPGINGTIYQRHGNKCHKNCPSEYRQKFSECILPRVVLSTKYMICPEGHHRYEAYCCIPGENCPHVTCNVGDNVPGKFFYKEETGLCERQAESITRVTTTRPPNTPCPDHLTQIWGSCQEPCPIGFRPAKGRCDLFPCIFNPMTDRMVQCPEGTYTMAQAIF